jgi:alpha-1,3-rhamnosyl/mannosyltransferase
MLSLDEGFGLPALEAMAHGCPVVASSAAALPEVVGSAGLLVDPVDVSQVVAALRRAVSEPSLRSALVARGRYRAESFSWAHTASAIRSLYRAAVSAPVCNPAARMILSPGV